MTDRSEAKHTPGPWKAEQFLRPAYGNRGIDLIGFKVIAPGALPDGRDVQICEAFPAPHPVAVREENARLIAAAPALLEALEGLADVVEHDCQCPPCVGSMAPGEHYLGLSRAALKLARGEA